jgi:hypothetical protein
MRPSAWHMLLEGADRATRTGRAEWRESATEQGVYVLAQSSGSLICHLKRTPDGVVTLGEIELLDGEGRQVDVLEYRNPARQETGSLRAVHQAAANLADAILKRADVAERVANDILKELRTYPPPMPTTPSSDPIPRHRTRIEDDSPDT